MRSDGRRVYDTFMFFQELDLLEIRLTELDDVVDYFVLAESPMTHSGKDKPLIFEENKERFAKWLPKIHHLVVDLGAMKGGSWKRENFNRSCLSQACSGYYDVKVEPRGADIEYSRPEDIIGVFDLDEIPRADAYTRFDPETGISRVGMPLFYGYINYAVADIPVWTDGVIFTHEFGMLRNWQLNGHWLRTIKPRNYDGKKVPIIPDAGWHFSYVGGVDMIKNKLQSYAHTELAHLADNEDALQQRLDTGAEILGRRRKISHVPVDDTYPRAILEDPEKYAHLIKEL